MLFKKKKLAAILTALMALNIGGANVSAKNIEVNTTASSIKERVAQIINENPNEKKKNTAPLSNKTMHLWPVTSKDEGGTLLFSDSPEYVDKSGILYQDTVSGEARVLYYHLNNTNQPKKVAVVLENMGANTANVRITRGGASKPSSDYLEVGKATQLAYFGKAMNDGFMLEAGENRLLRADMDTTILQPGELVYGVYDFYSSENVKVSVIMYPDRVNPLTYVKRAPILPKDEYRLRGTFPGMNRIFTAEKAYNPDHDGTVYFPIGDNVHDTYRTGIDATDGSKVENYGNYGILYMLDLPTAGKSHVKYYLNPLGGVYAGAMTVRQGRRTSLLPTPEGRTYFGENTATEEPCVQKAREMGIAILNEDAELSDLGTYPSGHTTTFEYSPPGASNLPVNIIMTADKKNK